MADDHAELFDRLQLYTESLPFQVSTYTKRKIMPHLASHSVEDPQTCAADSEVRGLVLAQYRELRKAVVGLGEFKLDKKFISHQIVRDVWVAMD
ncbi:hypothetical protein RRG08_005462 [Elysia crispata]|uniref:Uncharacterized protein n=1 Tax=Elysia crispata TaxID=231223 RepID=A0AAE0Y172_9GAST|nr:hypothetical protein RRG08_005462 [Elysia crispata]